MEATTTKAARRQVAIDLVQQIRAQIAATADADKQIELLSLGIDILRQRQSEQDQARRPAR
jgi:hypothetical protein